MTAIRILQIAIEVDKYDLGIAFRYANRQWLKPRDSAGREDMGYLLTAAFLFGNNEMFRAQTTYLILNYRDSYLGFLNDQYPAEILPLTTFSM